MGMIESGTFDCVLCMFTLLNLKGRESQRQALSEMRRVAREGGKIFIMFHAGEEGKTVSGRWLGERCEYRTFTAEEIKELASDAGIFVLNIESVHDVKYIFAVLSKTWTR